jgi:hypothetical protein
MSLPLNNPPRPWTAHAKGAGAILRKSAADGVQVPSSPVLLVLGALVFGAITAFRILTSSMEATSVLISLGTLFSLAVVGAAVVMILRVGKTMEDTETITLEPNRIIKQTRRMGTMKTQSLDKAKVNRVIHSRSRNRDGSRADVGSVELEYRNGSEKTEEFYVMYSTVEEEVLWFVRLMEAWTGSRARVEDYVIDGDDDDDGDYGSGEDERALSDS